MLSENNLQNVVFPVPPNYAHNDTMHIDNAPHATQPSKVFTMLLRLFPTIVTAPLVLQLISLFLKSLTSEESLKKTDSYTTNVQKEVMLMYLEQNEIIWLTKIIEIFKKEEDSEKSQKVNQLLANGLTEILDLVVTDFYLNTSRKIQILNKYVKHCKMLNCVHLLLEVLTNLARNIQNNSKLILDPSGFASGNNAPMSNLYAGEAYQKHLNELTLFIRNISNILEHTGNLKLKLDYDAILFFIQPNFTSLLQYSLSFLNIINSRQRTSSGSIGSEKLDHKEIYKTSEKWLKASVGSLVASQKIDRNFLRKDSDGILLDIYLNSYKKRPSSQQRDSSGKEQEIIDDTTELLSEPDLSNKFENYKNYDSQYKLLLSDVSICLCHKKNVYNSNTKKSFLKNAKATIHDIVAINLVKIINKINKDYVEYYYKGDYKQAYLIKAYIITILNSNETKYLMTKLQIGWLSCQTCSSLTREMDKNKRAAVASLLKYYSELLHLPGMSGGSGDSHKDKDKLKYFNDMDKISIRFEILRNIYVDLTQQADKLKDKLQRQANEASYSEHTEIQKISYCLRTPPFLVAQSKVISKIDNFFTIFQISFHTDNRFQSS